MWYWILRVHLFFKKNVNDPVCKFSIFLTTTIRFICMLILLHKPVYIATKTKKHKTTLNYLTNSFIGMSLFSCVSVLLWHINYIGTTG